MTQQVIDIFSKIKAQKKKITYTSFFNGAEISAINFISRYENWGLLKLENRIDIAVKLAYSSIRYNKYNQTLPEELDWNNDFFSNGDFPVEYVCPDGYFRSLIKQKYPFVEDPTRLILNLYIQTFLDNFNGRKSYDYFKTIDDEKKSVFREDEEMYHILEERNPMVKRRGRLTFIEAPSIEDYAIKQLV